MRPHTCVTAGALLAAAAVACGAFGAHGLKAMLEETGHAATWETACRYALFHALALVAVGTLGQTRPALARRLSTAAWAFLAGTAVFSGCLIALSLTGIRGLGAVVPVGGAALIAGWLLVAWASTHADD